MNSDSFFPSTGGVDQRDPFGGSAQDPFEKLPLPSGGWLHPTRPSPDSLTFDDLAIVAGKAQALGAGARQDYFVGQHALLVSMLFDDARLALAGLLFSLPEAFYGRVCSQVMSQLPPGADQVLRRYDAGLRRSLYLFAGLSDLRRCELDYVAECDSVAWNAAYWRIVFGGVAPGPIEGEVAEVLEANYRIVRSRCHALLEAGGGAAIAGRYEEGDTVLVAELMNFDPISREKLGDVLVARAKFLMERIPVQHRVEFFEPELLERFNREDIEADALAYRAPDRGEFDAENLLAGPPSMPPDVGEVTLTGGDIRVDWAAQRVAYPEMADEIDRLERASKEFAKAADDLLQARLRMMQRRRSRLR